MRLRGRVQAAIYGHIDVCAHTRLHLRLDVHTRATAYLDARLNTRIPALFFRAFRVQLQV